MEALPTTENGINIEAWSTGVHTEMLTVSTVRAGQHLPCQQLWRPSVLPQRAPVWSKKDSGQSQIFVVCSQTEEMVRIHYAEQKKLSDSRLFP